MAKLGIIADTHDNYTGTKKAIEIFRDKGCDMILHLGDLIAPPMLNLFRDTNTRFVLGNNEGEIPFLLKKAEENNVEFDRYVMEVESDGKKIAGFHGYSEDITNALISSGRYDYVLVGHTHGKFDRKEGNVRVINPGALFLGQEEKTVAVLDTEKDELEFVNVNE
ncbi:MAG: metallophosphoesterase [Candidatus Woesearchaeota archaeon]